MFRHRAKPDTARVLGELKPFQRDTVDYVFARMYEREPQSRRFLIADEVGLGKTIVARGLMARMIDRLWEYPDHRIDVVYICSNSSIARQNLNKLNFFQKTDYPIPDRITMLPQVLKDLESERLNLVSFTPGTSFNLGSSEGRVYERALLYWLLPEAWRPAGAWQPAAVLMGGVRTLERFQRAVEEHRQYADDWWERQNDTKGDVRRAFLEALSRRPDLATRFEGFCSRVGRNGELSEKDRAERAMLVGTLRSVVAETCVLQLEPDLVILDEFQRFKDLLDGTDAASELAQHLFRYPDARVLLLSATPYKMYTLHEEAERDNHFADFARTVRFLEADNGGWDTFESAIEGYRDAIFTWSPDDGSRVRVARQEVEDRLRRVMVRTERLASTVDRNGMLVEVAPTRLELKPKDVRQYARLQRTARIVGYSDVMEFWKSAPFLLNFMEDYDFKERFVDSTARPDVARRLADVLVDDQGCLLNWNDIESYRALDPANARLRSLIGATTERDTASLLWIPPTLPYYELGGSFARPGTRGFTKQLVFSSWQVVPKVVAALLTYEAERFLVSNAGEPSFANTAEARKREGRLLRFSRSKGRLTGMPLAALLYPSETLATLGDPLEIARALREDSGRLPRLEDVLAIARQRIAAQLDVLGVSLDGAPDESWYWAAPVMMDDRLHPGPTRAWFNQGELAAKWAGEEADLGEDTESPAAEGDEHPQAWQEHVDEFRRLLRRAVPLGGSPKDLVDTLALIAIAGPANVALRSLKRLGPSAVGDPVDLRNAAGRVASAIRSIFNDPAITAFLRASVSDDRYWRLVLNYCAEGCLQSVLDEYVHLLGDCGGRRGKRPTDFVKPMLEALTLYSATMSVDQISVDGESGTVAVTGAHARRRLRTSYAARFGSQGRDDAGGAERNRKLQAAFNSPFWPFVLCSTSIGQEGLDFHYYCHSVVHWNLPSNPVDLEQREGRVHRYKGHAVRKNVAARYGLTPLTASSPDPWHVLFRMAKAEVETDDGGLTPFWLYPLPDGARIERHVPALPLSLDSARAEALRRSLAVYRMAFGQARQEDVVAFLQRFPADQLKAASDDLRIDLSPPKGAPTSVSQSGEPEMVPNAATDDSLAPVWADVADGPPDAHFGAVEALLDEFKALFDKTADCVVQADEKVDRLVELLDAFLAEHRRDREVEDADRPGGTRTRSADGLRSLLDEFALQHGQPSTAADDPIPRLVQLLDEFVSLRALDRSLANRPSESSSYA